MIAFDRLVLSGFKSFVDRTEMVIPPGLTGIVGPNGCGKSNLVEALRWAMGESSAKRMRGGDMDDVIFNGSSSRPARNFAEVLIYLDNKSHIAPEPYAAFDEIEISRRIEREQGSVYRVNGKIARARDVQLLFADTLTGANSPALVSQGKLTQIISAKPFDRRMILEESAGITGLHARRHEAELRLQAADNNLTRLQDVVGGLETQLAALKRQSRQAEKYRVLSDEIKTLETTIAALDWLRMVITQQAVQHDFLSAESIVAEAMTTVSQLAITAETQAMDLPKLRTQAANASARHQAVSIELRQIESEENTAREAISSTESQLKQIKDDLQHDSSVIAEGSELLAKLDSEQQQITAEDAQQEGRLPNLEATRESVAARLKDEEDQLQGKLQTLIETQTKRTSLSQQIDTEDQRIRAADTRKQDVATKLAALSDVEVSPATDELQAKISAFESQLMDSESSITTARTNVQTAEQKLADTRATIQTTREQLTRADTEKTTLETFLTTDLSSTSHPVLNDIKAETGFEQAVAQALGETLYGSTDDAASMVWRGRTGLTAPTFPAGVTPLSDRVTAPVPLQAALSYIGYVADQAQGNAAADHLTPGQMIVSLDGYLWRWDGFFAKPSANDRQKQILEHKNRLAKLVTDMPTLQQAHNDAQNAVTLATAELATARESLTQIEQQARTLQNDMNAARQSLQKMLLTQQQNATEHARYTESLALIAQDIAERGATLNDLKTALAQLPDPITSGLDSEVADLREKVTWSQAELREANLSVDRFNQDAARRRARMHGIADQRIALNNRTARATEHLEQLKAREEQAVEKLSQLSGKPTELQNKRLEMMSLVSELENGKISAESALGVVEAEVAATTKALREAESTLSTAKENRAGLQARATALQEQLTMIDAEIVSQFSQSPQELMTAAGLSFDTDPTTLPHVEDLRTRKEKLTRDRDNIGPVNLRADVEAQELDGGLTKLLSERDDLMAAIAELRGGIATINVEAKERLVTAFETINTHFKDLFTRLFGGGQAYLQLIETDDPLSSGLEIFAQPPGKTLQSISLLSGGEQSLTAAALIFAMFLTNPSPICVLDEIDAPLDDANVDRICNLLQHIVEKSQTRFLIVTHHRLTMARMDRLYGVTMGEKGVSQLVSVDLSKQMDLLEAAE
jgi:chromosome segregation protein